MIKNSFDKGPEGWHAYDYYASLRARGEIFILTGWQGAGGVNNSGYVWADQSRWSTDVPERPISILSLIFYRGWIDKDPVDLREAEVSVYLRGDDLHLYGAECYFWAHAPGTRWHYSGHAIEISNGCWAPEPARFSLVNDESLWHRSWNNKEGWQRSYPPAGPSLDAVLGDAWSYGFSFVGFAREVHGRLSMDEFQILLPGSPGE